MTQKITGFTRPNTETKPAGAGAAGQSSRSEPGTAREAPESRQDAVSLTETATRLKSIEARLRDLPDVDQSRVEQLRQLIDAGEFEIDAERIAQRLTELERLLY